MWSNTRVTIWPTDKGLPDVDLLSWSAHFPEGFLEDIHSALVWTEPGAHEDKPEQLIVNTKPFRRTYYQPRLVAMKGRCLVLKALKIDEPSGTLRHIDEVYIVLREYHPP